MVEEINTDIIVETSMGKKIINVNSDLIMPTIIKSIYPKIRMEDFDDDYKIEIKPKKSFFKNIKLLPSGDERNFKETSLSIETIWRFSKIKTIIINQFDFISKLFYKNDKLNQSNIEIQTIKKNSIVKNISVASKKIGIISPIIPRKIRNADDK